MFDLKSQSIEYGPWTIDPDLAVGRGQSTLLRSITAIFPNVELVLNDYFWALPF